MLFEEFNSSVATTSLTVATTSLTVFVHVGKTGSSTAREWLRSAGSCDKIHGSHAIACGDDTGGKNHAHRNAHSNTPGQPWLCDTRLSTESRGLDDPRCANRDVVVGDGFGSCARVQPSTRPCSYFTILREPMSRLMSEWRYFCLGCAEGRKFCGRDVTTSCPNMSIAEWAARQPNQYTRHFGQAWARHVPANDSYGRAYYCSYVSGFTKRGCGAAPAEQGPPPPLEERDLERAVVALTAPDMLTLWTDQLDTPTEGWGRLVGRLSGTRAGKALAMAKLPTPVNVAHINHDEPPARELRAACAINAFDCRLFARLRNQSCACGS